MLTLKIVSPEKIEFDGAVKSVTVPGTLGQFEILVNHAPLISSLEKGDVKFTLIDGTQSILSISCGFVSIRNNKIDICVEV